MTWAKWFALATVLELGAFFGAVLHTPPRHALIWAAGFYIVTTALANIEARR